MGKWAVAGLVADDRAPGRPAAKDDPLFDKRAGVGVLRVQREFARQSNIGFMVTSRDLGATSNRVTGIDTRLRLGKNWTGTAQAMGSNTREAGGRRLSAPAYHASLLHQGQHLFFMGRYDDFSPDFRPQLGFIRRVDLREVTQYTEYVFRPKKRRVLSFAPGGSASVLFDHAGQRQDRVINPGFRMEFKGQTNFLVTAHDSLQRLRGRDQFTRRLSLRGIVDYNAVLPDAAIIGLEREKRLTGDVLATYLINPWTAIYVGYTDGYAGQDYWANPLQDWQIAKGRIECTNAAAYLPTLNISGVKNTIAAGGGSAVSADALAPRLELLPHLLLLCRVRRISSKVA